MAINETSRADVGDRSPESGFEAWRKVGCRFLEIVLGDAGGAVYRGEGILRPLGPVRAPVRHRDPGR